MFFLFFSYGFSDVFRRSHNNHQKSIKAVIMSHINIIIIIIYGIIKNHQNPPTFHRHVSPAELCTGDSARRWASSVEVRTFLVASVSLNIEPLPAAVTIETGQNGLPSHGYHMLSYVIYCYFLICEEFEVIAQSHGPVRNIQAILKSAWGERV